MKRLELTEKQFYYLNDLIENCMGDTWLGSRWRDCRHSNTELFELAEVRRKLWNLGHPYTKDEVIGESEDVGAAQPYLPIEVWNRITRH